jgi:hypothetical protein
MVRARFATAFTFVLSALTALSCAPSPPQDANTTTAADDQRWSRRLQCREAAQAKLAAEEQSQREAESRGEHRLLMFAPEYCYSETLNTCICDEHGFGDGREYRAVVDLLSGRKLAAIRTGDGPAKWQIFGKQRQKLFASCSN